MTADQNIIAHLNAVLKSKLTGINQYFLHARILKHRGNMQLADFEYKASLEAMKHSDMLVERVLVLGGSPNLQELGSLMIGETDEEMMHNDLAMAQTSLATLKAAISACEPANDLATLSLLGKILESHQERMVFLKNQLTPKMKDCA